MNEELSNDQSAIVPATGAVTRKAWTAPAVIVSTARHTASGNGLSASDDTTGGYVYSS